MRGRLFGKRAKSLRVLSVISGLGALAIVLMASPSIASAAECTDTWVGPSEGNWQSAYNWSTESVPTSADVACIGAATTVKVKSGTSQVAVVQGLGGLRIQEGTLEVLSSETASEIADLTLGYQAGLGGPATLEVSEHFEWANESAMWGSGVTVLGPDATGAVTTGGGWAVLSERRFLNEGTLDLSGGVFAPGEGAVFENVGIVTADKEWGLWDIVDFGGAAPRIVNRGRIQKTSGTGETDFEIQVENFGEIDAEEGTIGFNQENGSGVLASGSSLEGSFRFSGPTFLVQSCDASNSSIRLEKSTLDVEAGEDAAFGDLTLEYLGGISGAGTAEIIGLLNWSGGSIMSGLGATVVAASAEIDLTTYDAYLIGRTLINEGTIDLEGEGTLREAEGARVENNSLFKANSVESYGRWPGVQTEGSSETQPLFINNGTVRKNVGEGNTRMNVSLENNGSIEAQSGTLLYNQAGATVTISPASTLSGDNRFETTAIAGEDFEVTSGGLLAMRESELSVAGTGTVVANFEVGYGTKISGPGDIEVTQSLNWIGQSTIGGSGTMVLAPASENTLNSGATTATLSGRRLENEGTFTQTSSSRLNLNGAATFVNQGTYNLNAEPYPSWVRPLIEAEGAEPGRFVNSGTLQRTEGTGAALITSSVENSGPIVEKSGKIEVEQPVTVPASTGSPYQSECGDPVDCATGNFTESQTDLQIGGRGVSLDLARTYSTQSAVAGSLGIFGYGWTNSFGDKLTSEESGAKETLTEASGDTATFTKSGAAWLAPSWSAEVLTGSAELGFTLTLRNQTKEKFNGSGRLESVTDHDGNETTLAYDGSGKLETITDPTGRKVTLTYNAEALVEKATDPMGHEVKYAYESKQLKSVTLPGEASPSWQFEYDGSHRMTSMTDGRGGKTTNEYDSSNRVISQTDPMERKTTWEYAGFHTDITNNATGAVTDEWFNSNNQPLSVTHGFGTASATTECFTYTATGLLASRTDGNGHTTSDGYDANGNRIKETDPEGDETKWTYNEAHEVTSETKPNGEKTTIGLNAGGDPETVSRPAPESETQTLSYEYGPHGEVKAMTDPLGHVWSYGYDKYGNRMSETDPEGDGQTWGYNEDSQVISKVSPRGNVEGAEAAKYTTSIERDAQGRPVKVTDPLGGTTKFAYDPDGNIESITDPNGHKTNFTYDADNERSMVERPNGAIEETGYDGAGQITSQIDGDEQKTTYVRNVLEQPVEIIDPLERKSTQTFDAGGNLESKTNPDGPTTTFGYDKADRLKEIAYSAEPGEGVTFAYNEDGQPTSMVDGTGESTWEYDPLGRLTQTKDGHGEAVGWAYNLADEPVGLTYPNGKSISRAYDKAGRLESVTDWLGHTTSFAYNRDSRPTTTTFPIATADADEYGYDRADRMTSVTMKKSAETLASLAYSRDPAGQLESLISKGLPGAETESFSYDENERLTKAGSAEFGYDAANNFTKGPGTTNAYDKASEIESATGAGFTFDKEGERTKETPSSGPATTYRYSQVGNLTAIERPEEGETSAISESFGYDGSGLLASRTVGLTTTHFVWDPTESPGLLLSDVADSYLYGPGGIPFEQISNEEAPTYRHHDQLGSTRLLTDATGEAVGTFTYGARGGLTGHTGTASTSLGYAGQYTLGQGGLLYLRARFYDPATAQFLTLDPLASITRAPYLYANDNPVNRRDRTGQTGEAIEGGCPSPICFPFPTSSETQGAAEAIEALPGEIAGGISSAWNSIFGGSESTSSDESSEESVPCAEPVPPGHNPDTWERRPGSREGSGDHWWDPEGGEWGWHAPDKHHPEGHWDYNPWRVWNDEWQNIFP